MTDWSWKQAVADEVLGIVNEASDAVFSLEDVYARTAMFQQRFPENRFIREKVRQTLQRLRDDGFIIFLGSGRYELNTDNEDLAFDFVTTVVGDGGVPRTRQVVRNVRLRNSLLATHVKRRYQFCCQICRIAIRLTRMDYAEAHHVQPLGAPHFGADIEGNILVLCPNHHVMFDRGAISLDPQSLLVKHVRDAFEPVRLFVLPWHTLDSRAISYHQEQIFGRT